MKEIILAKNGQLMIFGVVMPLFLINMSSNYFMDFKIVAWNIRSMYQLKKNNEVVQLIREEQLSVCAVLETHVKQEKLVDTTNKVFINWNWCANIAYTKNGCRILIGWNQDIVNLMVISMIRQTVLCLIEGVNSNIRCFLQFHLCC